MVAFLFAFVVAFVVAVFGGAWLHLWLLSLGGRLLAFFGCILIAFVVVVLEGACLHFCAFVVAILGVRRLVALFVEFVIGLLGGGVCLVQFWLHLWLLSLE